MCRFQTNIKKTKRVKSTLKRKSKKVVLIFEDEESVFINQLFRKDMLTNTKLIGKEYNEKLIIIFH